MADEIEINRGSDLDFTVRWRERDEAGVISPIDLTGGVVSLFEPHPALVGNLTATLDPDPTTGDVQCRLEWAPDMPTGRRMSFRVMVTFGTDNQTSPLIWVLVK